MDEVVELSCREVENCVSANFSLLDQLIYGLQQELTRLAHSVLQLNSTVDDDQQRFQQLSHYDQIQNAHIHDLQQQVQFLQMALLVGAGVASLFFVGAMVYCLSSKYCCRDEEKNDNYLFSGITTGPAYY